VREVPGLIDLGTKYFERGLRLLFFPCNQFCSEEPGTAADIAAFYVGKHGLPASSLMERVDVNGPHTHAVYTFLRRGPSSGAIEWNFTKFVVGRDGQVLQRCGQGVKPPFFDEQLPAWLS
jgi:glutathione peroxidase-family protein